MSEIESKVKAIIVDKLGVDEAEVKPEASFTRTQNKFFTKHNGCFLPEATIMLYC